MSTENKSVEPVIVEPVAMNSEPEFGLFSYAMLEIVPQDKRSKAVKKSIKSIYDAYYNVVRANRNLAVLVYEFSELTGVTYQEIAKAMEKGIQHKFSEGYIGKLYHGGKAMKLNPLAERITDIDKLSTLGRLSDADIKTALVEKNGVSYLGEAPVQLLDRAKFKTLVHEHNSDPDKKQLQAASTWSIASFSKSLEAAIKGSAGDPELLAALGVVKGLVDVRIKAKNKAKTDSKAVRNETVGPEMQASA